MSHQAKFILGVMTFSWAVFYAGVMSFWVLDEVYPTWLQGKLTFPHSPNGVDLWTVVRTLMVVWFLIYFALLLTHVVLALQNPRVGVLGGLLWILGFAFISGLAMPIYWYSHVWREPEEGPGNDNEA